MKRVLIFAFVLISSILPAAEKNKNLWEGSVSGDYVIYRDKSWKDPAWLGFLYYNDNSIGAFLYVPEQKVRAEILFSGEESEGKFVLTGQNIISERSQEPAYILAVNYLMELLPDLYSFKTKPQIKNVLLKRSTKAFTEKHFGGICEFEFLSYIPLFHLQSVKDSNRNTVLQLEHIGRIKQNNDTAFFKFEPVEIKKSNSDFVLDGSLKKEIKTIDGIDLHLDGNWIQIADNCFLMGNNAFLTVNTMPAAAFDGIPGDTVSSAVKLFSLSGGDVKVLIEEMILSGTENNFRIENTNVDEAAQQVNKDLKTIIKKGQDYTIVSLTVNASVYKKYKKYFEALF